MSLSWFSSLLLFALITCGTPGPNNMLLTTAAAHGGFRRSVPLLFAVVGGLNLLMLVTALGVAGIVLGIPGAQLLLKLLGSGYLLWLAWRQARAGEPGQGQRTQPLGFVGAALFQWVNPKAWMMGVNTAILFLPSGSGWWTAASLALVCIAVNLPCVAVWAVAGDCLRHRLHDPLALRAFNLSMAALLAGTALWILVEATLSH